MKHPIPKNRFYDLNYHIPKLQLFEVFPLTPFLDRYERLNVFDVGANTGLWSEAFLRTNGARTGSHVMFEPIPGNVEQLNRRDENILSKLTTSTEVVATAVGDDLGVVDIHYDKAVTTLASISNRTSKFGVHEIALTNTISVPLTSVDAEIEKRAIDRLHLMKIDVEGHEMHVIKGAENALRDGRIRNIYFEFGIHQLQIGETFREFYTYLTQFGFTLYKPSRGINFFGLAQIRTYRRSLEPSKRKQTVEMVLASLDGPDPDYRGPNVLGRPI